MRIRPPGGDPYVDAEAFISGDRILYGKLIGTMLGAAWLVFVGGLITVQTAIVELNMTILDTIQQQYVRLIGAVFGGGAGVIEQSWAAAYEAMVQASPILAPLTLAVELLLVLALLQLLTDRAGGRLL